MSRHWRYGVTWVWFLFLGWFVMGAAVAAPEYVTAWPRQVPIEQPDPVLGDKPYWEHWVYSESFARRFSGTTDGKRFSVEKADPELKGKLYALVLRIYKTNFWDYLNKDYPEQYACEIDVFFDAHLDLPLQQIRRPIPGKARTPNLAPSYQRLIAYNEQDRAAIQQSEASQFYLFRKPAVFVMPPDGRVQAYGATDYRPNLAPGLSYFRMIAGGVGDHCPVAAPLHPQGEEWLSLKGVHPYRPKDRENQPDIGFGGSGSYDRKYEGLAFDPGPDPESQGLFRIPRSFHDVALQKAALVKVMNWCIARRHSPSDWRVSRTAEGWSKMFTHVDLMQRCEQAERYGRILPDPRYHPNADGLMDTGY